MGECQPIGYESGHFRAFQDISGKLSGGEGGIRTRDTLADIPVFETGAFNHSATSPEANTRSFSGLSDPLANLSPILLSFEGELFVPFYHSFGL